MTLRVRLEGIDCPERGEPFSTQARNATRVMLFDEHVTLKATDVDRYGRLVARSASRAGNPVSNSWRPVSRAISRYLQGSCACGRTGAREVRRTWFLGAGRAAARVRVADGQRACGRTDRPVPRQCAEPRLPRGLVPAVPTARVARRCFRPRLKRSVPASNPRATAFDSSDHDAPARLRVPQWTASL